MFVDQVAHVRNARFMAEKMRIRSLDIPEGEKDTLLTTLVKDTFKQEFDATGQYASIKVQVEKMHEEREQLLAGNKKINKRFSEKLEKLEQQLSMPIESFIAQSLFQSKSMRELKSEFKDVELGLKRQIKQASSTPQYAGIHPCARHLPATVDVFKERYPNVIEQLRLQAQSQNKSMPILSSLSAVALNLLKDKSPHSLQNPKMNSRAFLAVTLTQSFAPMMKRLSYGIGQFVDKVSLKPAVKQLFESEPVKRLQHIAMGVGLSMAVVLGSYGLMEKQDVVDLKLEFASVIQESSELRQVTLSSTHVPGVSNAPDPETTVLFSPLLTVEQFEDESLVMDESYDDGVVLENAENNEPIVEPSSIGGVYTVDESDTLSEIAQAQLQHANIPYSYDDIMAIVELTASQNGIDDPDRIKVGQTINLVNLTEYGVVQSPEVDPELASVHIENNVAKQELAMPSISANGIRNR